jgi:hypothetical protein
MSHDQSRRSRTTRTPTKSFAVRLRRVVLHLLDDRAVALVVRLYERRTLGSATRTERAAEIRGQRTEPVLSRHRNNAGSVRG